MTEPNYKIQLPKYTFRCVTDCELLDEKFDFCFRNFGSFQGNTLPVINYMQREGILRTPEDSNSWSVKLMSGRQNYGYTRAKFYFLHLNDLTRFHLAYGTRSWAAS